MLKMIVPGPHKHYVSISLSSSLRVYFMSHSWTPIKYASKKIEHSVLGLENVLIIYKIS